MEKKLNPKHFPHFMEKPLRKTYRSFKILGQMYDAVNRVHFTPNYQTPFDSRILKRYTLDDEMLKKARHIKTQYDTAMKRIMGQMEIRTEFEVLSAFVMSKPLVGTQYKQHETVRRETDALKQQFKDECIEAAGGSREFKVLAPFVAAMYQVTNEEVQIALYESRTPHVRKDGTQGYRQIKPESMPLISFPWLFDGVLGRIARGSTEAEQQAKANGANTKETSSNNSKPTPSLDYEDLKKMEYARTSSGIVHRGQILRLFHHDDEDDVIVEEEEEEEEQQQQHSFGQPVPDRHKRRPAADLNAEIRPSQQLGLAGSPSKPPVGGLRNKLNNGPSAAFREQPGKANKVYPQKFQSRPQNGGAMNTGTTSGPNGQYLSLAPPDEDLISFDSPPKGTQHAAQDFAALSLMDMDDVYTGYVPQTGEGQQITANGHANIKPRSESVRAKIKARGFIPVAEFLAANGRSISSCSNSALATMKAMSTSATSGGTVVARGFEEKKDEKKDDDDDDGDLEVEEVVIDKKATTSAFDDLAKLA